MQFFSFFETKVKQLLDPRIFKSKIFQRLSRGRVKIFKLPYYSFTILFVTIKKFFSIFLSYNGDDLIKRVVGGTLQDHVILGTQCSCSNPGPMSYRRVQTGWFVRPYSLRKICLSSFFFCKKKNVVIELMQNELLVAAAVVKP